MLGKVTLCADQRKPRSLNYVNLPDVPIVPNTAPLSGDRNDIDTAIQGAAKRFAKVTRPFQNQHAKPLKKFVKQWCRKHLRPIECEMSFEDWLDSTDYSTSRKEELRQCRDRYV